MRDSEITTDQRRLCGGGSTEPGMEKQVQPSMEKPVWGNRSMSKVMGSGWEDLVSLATLEWNTDTSALLGRKQPQNTSELRELSVSFFL